MLGYEDQNCPRIPLLI